MPQAAVVPIAAGIASGAAGALVSRAASGGSSSGNLGPPLVGSRAGGLRVGRGVRPRIARLRNGELVFERQRNPRAFGNASLAVAPDPGRTALVNQLAGSFGTAAGRIENLLAPGPGGISQFRQAGLDAIGNRATRSIGNLRQNLANRRIQGSSFAQSALDRAQAEFAQEEAEFVANTLLQEVELINLAAQNRAAEAQTLLDELNLQADIALQLNSGVQATLGANARLKALLSTQAAAGRGRLAGQAFEPVQRGINEGITSLLTPTPTTTATGRPAIPFQGPTGL